MSVFSKIWATLLTITAIVWFVDAVRLVFDNSYHPDTFNLVVAFLITGGCVAKWAIEEWNRDEK